MVIATKTEKEKIRREIPRRPRVRGAGEGTSEDLQLINLINNAANQGYSLPRVIQLLVRGTKKIFSSYGATFYEISEDQKYLVMHNLNMPQPLVSQIEKIIGTKLPPVRIRLEEGSLYRKALRRGKPQLISAPETIQKLMAECTENKLLKKLVPRINKLLGIASVINVPLISEGETLGLLDISRKTPFTRLELERFTTIAQQLPPIIKRKQAEEALQAEKNKLQSVITAMEDAFTIQDKDYNIIYQNETLKGIFGDRLGQKCYQAYEGQDKLCEGCPVEKAFRDGKPHTSERRVILPSGELTFWETRANPIRDAGGRVVSCLEIAHNITERKQAEEALQAEKNKLQSVITAMEDGLSIQDKDYNIIYQNEPSKKGAGGDRLGEKCYRVYEGRESACEGCPVEKAFQDGRSHTAERSRLEPAGWFTFWENTANPIRDARGEIVACLEITHNITERKQAEEARWESEERFRSIVENSQTGIMILDDAYRFTYVNDELCRMSGYSRQEVIGQDFRQFLDEESRQLVADRYIRRQRGEEVPPRYEFNIIRKDGQKRRVEISSSVIKDSAGKVKTIAQLLDITVRKQAEEALRESREELRKMFESVTDGISVIDLNGVIIEVNQRTAEIHGFSSKDELIGKSALELVVPQDRERVTKNMKKALSKGAIRGEEYTLLRADGTQFPGELSTSVLRDAAGKAVGHVSISRDITERKRAEEALRKIEGERSAILNSMAELMVYQDTEHRILLTNKAAAESVALSIEQLVGRRCYEIWHQSNKPCAGCPIAKARETGKPQEAEMTTPDGRVWFVRGYPVRGADEKLTGVVEVTLDITARKKQEQALADELVRRRILVDQSLDGIVVLDVDARVYEANQRFAEMLGYTLEEVRELHTWDWDKNYPPEQLLEMGRNVDEKGLRLETRHQRKDGSVIDVDISINGAMFGEQKLIFCVCRDITERKKQEKELQESQKFVSSLLESSPNPITVVNLDTSLRYVNPAFEKLTGFTSAEVVGVKAPYPWFPEGKRERILVSIKDAVEHGGRRTERNFQKKNGERFWVSLNTAPVMQGGKPVYLIYSWLDITASKKAEEEVRQAKEQFQTLVEEAPVGVAMIREDDSFQYVNPQFVKIFGYTLEDITTQHEWFAKAYPDPEYREQVISIWNDDLGALKQGEERHLTATVTCKDGSEKIIYFSAALLETGDFLMICEDVTERKRAEEALQAEKNKLESLIGAMEDHLVIINTDYKIIYQNEPSKEVLGDQFGKTCYRAFEGRESVCEGCPVEQAFQDGKSHTWERRRVSTSGEVNFWETTATPVRDAGGRIVSCLEVSRNITERKRAEEKEKQLQQELYRARRLASVGELAAGVAHEINNPLTGVLGFSQRLMRKSTSEELSRDLAIIHDEAQRAAKIVQGLLTFARRREPKMEQSNINDIVRQALELRNYALQTGNIEVVTDLAPSLPPVMADFHQIQEVFLNIILNAEQAMSESHGRGKLTIRTQQVKDYVMVSFADDGPGISTEHIEHVFDPFFTTRAEKGGTGLGLSACHGIVTEHGGKIYVRSKLGRGATFFVELPLSPD